ncbi:hypothetical protein F5141DRAFT_1223857 [Pisolithus sp. B1]|nr:hypothetical protein F5141DRAFT_1223857 [Pisolithus sp. B1]
MFDSPGGYSKHPEFYTHTVTFLGSYVQVASTFSSRRESSNTALKWVKKCLFRITKELLEAESNVFSDMFLLPQGDPETVEGKSDTYPVVLQGTSKKDFESLLRALMYRSYLDCDQWISVLKLFAMWDFRGLRNAAIQHLDVPFQSLNPVDKLELALLACA